MNKASAQIHHLALKVRDLDQQEYFYSKILKLPFLSYQYDSHGNKRSVWYQLDPGLLMLEHDSSLSGLNTSPSHHGWYLLAFKIHQHDKGQIKSHLQKHGVVITHESDFSFYFCDPEGNRLAYSYYDEVAHA